MVAAGGLIKAFVVTNHYVVDLRVEVLGAAIRAHLRFTDLVGTAAASTAGTPRTASHTPAHMVYRRRRHTSDYIAKPGGIAEPEPPGPTTSWQQLIAPFHSASIALA